MASDGALQAGDPSTDQRDAFQRITTEHHDYLDALIAALRSGYELEEEQALRVADFMVRGQLAVLGLRAELAE